MERVGTCAECGFLWESEPPTLVSGIQDAPALYAAALERLDPTGLGHRPGTGVWSPIEYAGHARDVAAFYGNRIERIATMNRPDLDAANFAAMVESRRSTSEDLGSVLASIQQRLFEVGARLARLSSGDWHRVGIGSEGDERTMLDLARRLAHELHHHQKDLDTPSP